MKLYVIYDRAAEECGPVFDAKNDQVAIRAYKRMWEKEQAGSMDEFWLYCVGYLDVRKMEITPDNYRVDMTVKGDIEDGK